MVAINKNLLDVIARDKAMRDTSEMIATLHEMLNEWEADASEAGPLDKKDLRPERFIRELRAALAASEARVAEYSEVIERAGENWRHQFDRAEAAEQSLAEARKDAERYRWLRKDIGVSARNSDCPRDVLLLAEWMESAEQLDAAIDALLPKGEGATS